MNKRKKRSAKGHTDRVTEGNAGPTKVDQPLEPPPPLETVEMPPEAELTDYGGAAPVEPPEETVRRLTSELGGERDRYLRLAAEFDNYRKRMARERADMWKRAQADLIRNVLDVIDDLARVVSQDAQSVAVTDVLAGVDLVERKLIRELESAGLVRVGQEGDPFDPNDHEAVDALPSPSSHEADTVAAVYQPGYRFGGALLRPARVQVYVGQDVAVDTAEPPDGDAPE